MSRLNLAAGLAVGALLLVPRLAQAHYLLVAPTNWWNQDPNPNGGGAPQKIAPCGSPSEAPTLKATNVVNVYQSGQPVTVTVTPTVAHPGWWRVSLREGAASTQTATSFPDPPELGAPNSALQCTPPFIDNPVWSPTQPVIADKLGLPAGATVTQAMATIQSATQNYQVMIPAAAHCSMAAPCTLQILMIMTDHVFPSCNYHHCADMALAGSTTGTGGTTGTTDAGTHDASAGTGGKTGAGGSTATGAGGSTTTGSGGSTMTGAGGSTTAGSGGTTGGGAGGATAGEGGSSGGDQDSGTTNVTVPSDNGCSCVAGGGVGVGGASSGILLIVLLALRRRRGKSAI